MGTNIKILMATKDMSNKDLALKTGLSEDYISKLRNNKANPTINVLEKIAKALEVNIKDLL